ncbi:MAG: hypothetical protein WED87_02605 [Dehalococcoidia bacterium]
MVNPVLTILFNLLLVGSALTIVAAMVQEYFDSRTDSVGGRTAARGCSAAPPSSAATLQSRQRRAIRKAA